MSGEICCTGCGRTESALDAAWRTLMLGSEDQQALLSFCTDCQRRLHCNAATLVGESHYVIQNYWRKVLARDSHESQSGESDPR